MTGPPEADEPVRVSQGAESSLNRALQGSDHLQVAATAVRGREPTAQWGSAACAVRAWATVFESFN